MWLANIMLIFAASPSEISQPRLRLCSCFTRPISVTLYLFPWLWFPPLSSLASRRRAAAPNSADWRVGVALALPLQRLEEAHASTSYDAHLGVVATVHKVPKYGTHGGFGFTAEICCCSTGEWIMLMQIEQEFWIVKIGSPCTGSLVGRVNQNKTHDSFLNLCDHALIIVTSRKTVAWYYWL